MDKDFNKITLTGVLVASACLVFQAVLGQGLFTLVPIAIVILAGTVFVNKFSEGYFCTFSYILIVTAAPVLLCLLTKLKLYNGNIDFLNPEAAVTIFVPVIVSAIGALWEKDVERNGFDGFFKEQLIYLSALYVVFMIYTVFLKDMAAAFPERSQFIPFATLAGYIEAVIDHLIPWQLLALYIGSAMTIYVPYGYLLSALMENVFQPVRIAAFLALPVAAELMQLIVGKNMCDIDDMFFGFLGALIGAGLWKLLNALFFAVTNHGCMGQTKELDL